MREFDEFAVEDGFALRFLPEDKVERTCNACLLTFPLTDEYFQSIKDNHSRFSNKCKTCKKLRAKSIKKAKRATNKCHSCNLVLPNTDEYFYFCASKKRRSNICRSCITIKGKMYYKKKYNQDGTNIEYVQIKEKLCKDCNLTLSFHQFHVSKNSKYGICNRCKECAKKFSQNYRHSRTKEQLTKIHRKCVLNQYKITQEQYQQMLDNQNGLCDICKKPEKNGGFLSIDHSHTTGKVRGLLCRLHNAALGSFNDDPVLIRAALEYLIKHQEREL